MKHLPASEQKQDTQYEMKLLFDIDLIHNGINDIAEACGFHERMILKSAATFNIEQTVQFIPNESDIEQYIKVIKSTYKSKNNEYAIHDCRFKGYEYLYIVG